MPTEAQTAEIARCKAYFPYRIAYGAFNPATGEFFAGVITLTERRTPSKGAGDKPARWSPIENLPRDGRPFVAMTIDDRASLGAFLAVVSWSDIEESLVAADGRGLYEPSSFEFWCQLPPLPG